MTAYKIVYNTGEILTSAFFNDAGVITPKYGVKPVQYIEGEFVTPFYEHSRLFAFSNLFCGIDWYFQANLLGKHFYKKDDKENIGLELWEAEVEGVEEDPNAFFVCANYTEISSFLVSKSNEYCGSFNMPPRGTLAVQKIKLVKKLDLAEEYDTWFLQYEKDMEKGNYEPYQ